MTDLIDQPIEYRYPSDERPRDPPTDKLPDEAGEWFNFWDYNPFEHGGLFCRWDGSEWEIVEFTPPSWWPEDEHVIEVTSIHPSDVWADPSDPMTDWSMEFKKELSTLQNPPAYPNADEVFDHLACHAAHYGQHWAGGRPEMVLLETPEDFWDEVESYGVDPGDLDHVDTEGMPDKYLKD